MIIGKFTQGCKHFLDFDKFAATADEWVEPTRREYEDWGDLWQHMKQPDAFDQFAVTFDDGKMTQVYTNDRPERMLNYRSSGSPISGLTFLFSGMEGTII